MAFVPGPTASRASGGTGAFCPGWRYQPGQKVPLLSRLVASPGTKGPTLLSRLVTPTRIKPFYPGWWHQPGQKDPFVLVGVTNPDKMPLHVTVQKEVILY